jgi:hypothetical protein
VALAVRLPQRIAGIMLRVPPAPTISTLQEQVGSVPTLIITAERDDIADRRITRSAFVAYRAAGGLWAFADEPGAGHLQLSAKTQAMYLAWIRAVLDARLPAAAVGPLRPMREEDGWLGNLATRDVSTWSAFVGDRRSASWLPSQLSAERWRSLVQ